MTKSSMQQQKLTLTTIVFAVNIYCIRNSMWIYLYKDIKKRGPVD